MTRTYEKNSNTFQNTSVMGIALIMVMSSFVGIVASTSSINASPGQPLSSSGTYSAFPDDDADSGKFLGVAGSGTLTNVPITCHIGVPAGETSFQLGVFDGDIGGHWDQVVSGSDYMDFLLYEDRLKDGTGSVLVTSWTQYDMVDDNWFSKTIPTSTGAQAPSGNYFYRLRVQWRNPGSSNSNNYFKLRTTGQISVAKGAQFAIMGGPLRIPFGNYGSAPWEANNLDPPTWAGDTDPSVNNVDANSYDGDWNFHFYVPKKLTSISFRDGDADIVIDNDDANTPPPEGTYNGAPSDGPSPYDGCNVPSNIKYTIKDPDGNTYLNSNPSGNMEWENFIISKNSTDNPDYLVSYYLSAGIWNMHFEGMDAHNMNFIEASHEIYTTTDPPLPVNPPPTLVPSRSETTSPGTSVNYGHTLTNKGTSDIFDLKATSGSGWTTKIYHDADGDGVLDASEVTAGEVSNTGTLATDATYDLIVQVEVPSGSGDATDYTTVVGSAQSEWNIQASLTDTTFVEANSPPVVDAGGPYTVNEIATLSLDGSGTYDPDGDPLEYYWDLDFDGFYDDSTDIYPAYSWSEDGANKVGLAVYDGELYGYDTADVTVLNVPPEIYSTTYVYTLTQGSSSWTIPAVESTLTAAEFYNYYSVSAHTGFEKPYQSFVYLYRDIDDPTNEVSLFIVHDIDGNVYYPGVGYNSGSPDAQSQMDLSGIPSGAYLAQSDDPGEFKVNYPSSGLAQGRWHWWYNTDGGAIGGLPTSSSWAITIDPIMWDDVNTWAYYYAGGSNINLNMNDPITIAYQAQTEPTTVSTYEGTGITLGAFARDWGSDDEPLDFKFEWNDPHDPGTSTSGTTPWDVLFTASHTYYEDGIYYPLLTVIDSDGATDSLTFTVNVTNVAPSVIAGSDKTVDEGTLVSVDGTFSDPGAYDTHIATWNWDDGSSNFGSVTEENIPAYSTGTVTGSHTYMDDGTYDVTLTVWDDEGDSHSDTLTITVNDMGPSASFLWSPNPADEGSPVSFTDTSTSYPDNIVGWSWDFGGLGTSTLQHPSFTFMDDGGYAVTLTVTDDDNSTHSCVNNVTIEDLAPIANFTWSPDTQYEGSPVHFTDLSESYPDDIVSWEWDFGDSGTSTSQNPDHTYGDNGNYTVTLTVTDDDGSITSISYTVTILNADPIVDAGDDQSTFEGTTVSFSGSFTDPGWLDTHTIHWDFGDGYTVTGTLTPSHAYGDNGVYNVTLTVIDDDGGVGFDYILIHVENVPPSVEPVEDQETYEGTEISLVLATFTDPGWLDTHTATIDWGDGTVDVGTVTESMGNGTVSGSHTYGDNGVFTVTVTVTDDDGDSDSTELTVTVYNVAPSIDLGGPYTAYENSPIDFSGHVTDPGSDDLTIAWVIEFGPSLSTLYFNNGVSPDPYPSPDVNPMDIIDLVTHTWGDNGVFVVTLTATDDDGDTTIAMVNVTVYNVAPAVNPGGPYEIPENLPTTLTGTFTDPGSDDLTITWDWGDGFSSTITTTHYNDGIGADPAISPDINPMSVIESQTHTYGDDGVYTVTLTVTDDDGATTIETVDVNVTNVAPTIVNLEAYMYVNFTLRVAGEKWHSVDIYLYEDGDEIWAASVTRYPGDPDEQSVTITDVKVDLTKNYTALVDYLPNEPGVNGNVWGGNPVWIDMTFEDGSKERLHHTFNVRQSDWESDHWNHIDPWEVDFASHIGKHNITFEASATDPGSDDLTFLWDFDDGSTSGPDTYFNNGVSPDPLLSPQINPMSATDTAVHRYSSSGTYMITLTVTDDDGGSAVITLTLEVG